MSLVIMDRLPPREQAELDTLTEARQRLKRFSLAGIPLTQVATRTGLSVHRLTEIGRTLTTVTRGELSLLKIYWESVQI